MLFPLLHSLRSGHRPGHRHRCLRTLAIACALLGPLAADSINGPVFAEVKAPVSSSSPALRHPLDPLSAAEIQTAFETVLTAFKASPDLPKQSLLFPLIDLEEPAKDFVLAWKPGQTMPRKAEVQILHNPSNRFWLAEIDLLTKRMLKVSLQPAGTQPGLEQISPLTERLSKQSPWLAAEENWLAAELALRQLP